MQTKKDEIIDIGYSLFSEKGYSNIGLKEILDKAMVPKGSFYHYFKSKEDFGIQVLKKYSENGLAIYKTVLNNDTINPSDRILLFYTSKVKEYKEQNCMNGCLLGNITAEMSNNNENIRELLAIEFAKWENTLENCIHQAINNKEINNELSAATMSVFIQNSWEGALLNMKCKQSLKPLYHFLEGLKVLLN